MKFFLDEIAATLGSGIYSTALISAIMVPDACGAIEFPSDRNGVRYAKWFDQYVRNYQAPGFQFDGAVVWKLRNGMIHETALALKEFGFDRVLFTTPHSSIIIHMCISQIRDEKVLNVDLETFCKDMINAGTQWLADISSDQEKVDKLDKLIQFRPLGLAPHIVGVPMVC